MQYELATLAYRPTDAEHIKGGIQSWVGHPDANGDLLGCWETEIGQLFRIYVLRGFADAEQLAGERARAHHSQDAFHAEGRLTGLEMDSYAPFPTLPAVQPGPYGAFYEIRTYHLIPGALPASIAGWQAALPQRVKLSPLTVVMYALDGPTRITHIWPYASLDARFALRQESHDQGIWPPEGGAERVMQATSTIVVPTVFSPLR